MLEIEQKYADADFTDLERRLTDWGITQFITREEEDHYFNAPDRDFRLTGEAFRMRRVGPANFLTYKGKRLQGEVKVRAELEIALREGDQAAAEFRELLGHLGYRAVAVVRKKRRIYHLTRQGHELEVCLDDVEEVGRFAELEILACEEGLEAARAVVLETAAALGLSNVERRAYLTMLLARREAAGIEGEKP